MTTGDDTREAYYQNKKNNLDCEINRTESKNDVYFPTYSETYFQTVFISTT